MLFYIRLFSLTLPGFSFNIYMYKYIGRFMMNILLSKTEQDLLFLLEELTKHHDWIEIPVLAEKLNFSIEELQEHLFKLEQLFPNLLLQSRKKRHSIAV